MAPPPKQQTRRSGGHGKRYTLRIGKRDKPTPGTAMPIQVIVSEINRTCASLNVRANSAEWTPFLNLQIYFTFDSLDSQIEKAVATILGVVCKGHSDPNTSFHKAVKWSRVVIRNVPKRKWVADADGIRDEDTGAPHGSFVPVTKEDIEAELRNAHPLLADTIFMEGPDWTRRPGSTPDNNEATANVSFAIPDHEEKRVTELTKRPITLFYTQCRMNRWTEKINLIQCTRCWKFGDKVHPACPIRCCQCGGQHDEGDHHKECGKCAKENIDQEARKNGETVCPHPICCPNCSGNHHADNKACRMRDHAVCEERQRRKIGRGQTLISKYLETPSS